MRGRYQTFVFSLLSTFLFSTKAFAPFAATCTTDLVFPAAAVGDANDVVAPTSSGGATISATGGLAGGRVSFNRVGTTINMTRGADTVSAGTITGSPTFGNNAATFSGTGAFTGRVGATRTAIAAADDPGDYSGTFQIAVRDRDGPGAPTINVTCTARLRVQRQITITKTGDLDFGTCARTDPAKVVAAGDFGSGTFLVTGEPNTSFNITLPTASFNMITGTGSTAATRIAVTSLTKNPTTPTLDASGNATFYVGGTRAAIPVTQTFGSYSGNFTVTVAYP